MTGKEMSLLRELNPLPAGEIDAIAPDELAATPTHLGPTARSSRRRRRLVTTIASCAAFLLVAAPAVATGAVSDLLTGEYTVAGDPMAAPEGEPYLDVNSPEWTRMINEDVANVPLPPGVDRAKTFSVLHQQLPLPVGATFHYWYRNSSTRTYVGPGLIYTQDSETGRVLGVPRSSVGAQAAAIAVNEWFNYWLDATPAQRRAAQPTLDFMKTWPDLDRALAGEGERGALMARIATIADAARNGNEKPMREWLSRADNPL